MLFFLGCSKSVSKLIELRCVSLYTWRPAYFTLASREDIVWANRTGTREENLGRLKAIIWMYAPLFIEWCNALVVFIKDRKKKKEHLMSENNLMSWIVYFQTQILSQILQDSQIVPEPPLSSAEIRWREHREGPGGFPRTVLPGFFWAIRNIEILKQRFGHAHLYQMTPLKTIHGLGLKWSSQGAPG